MIKKKRKMCAQLILGEPFVHFLDESWLPVLPYMVLSDQILRSSLKTNAISIWFFTTWLVSV